jgi:YgiT-type zinc finger domain-containing protein
MNEQLVTYTIQLEEKLVVVEHVPAKVCDQCGERLYSPETVERLQKNGMGAAVTFSRAPDSCVRLCGEVEDETYW